MPMKTSDYVICELCTAFLPLKSMTDQFSFFLKFCHTCYCNALISLLTLKKLRKENNVALDFI